MADQRKGGIAWTEETWNPVTGCTKVSNGCKFCYAERMFPRVYGRDEIIDHMQGDTAYTRPRKFTDVRLHEDRLDQPLRWKRPRKIFVNSMSDLFHEDVPDEFIDRVFAVMACAPRHDFQVLTKRPERMRDYVRGLTRGDGPDPDRWDAARKPLWLNSNGHMREHIGVIAASPRWPLPNVWLGVSVEDQATANERVPYLLQTPAAIRFVSAEPLLGPVDFEAIDTVTGVFPVFSEHGYNDNTPLRISALREGKVAPTRLDWCIVGGESGPKARPMHPDWVRSIRDQCRGANVPLLIKQLSGGKGKVIKDASLFPEDLQIREYPR